MSRTLPARCSSAVVSHILSTYHSVGKSTRTIVSCTYLRSSIQHYNNSCYLLQTYTTSRSVGTSSSPFDSKTGSHSNNSNSNTPTTNQNTKPTTTAATLKQHNFVPRKAAVSLTEKSRNFFKVLLDNAPRKDIVGIMLNYQQPKSGEPRMVFAFDYVSRKDLDPMDEGVSLELVEEKNRNGETSMVPKSPTDSLNDGLPKLYIHHNAFMKVLGATVDVDTETVNPILYDREGNPMDPNA